MEVANEEGVADAVLGIDDEELSCDESDDSDVGNKEGTELTVEEARAAVAAAPWSYENHERLINASRAAGDLTTLRSARRTMADTFPLPPAIWLQWLEDEMRAGLDSDTLNALAQEATSSSYLSVPLWLARLEIATGDGEVFEDCTSDSDTVRSVFEEAVSRAGLSFPDGIEVWKKYYEWETSDTKRVEIRERQRRVPLRVPKEEQSWTEGDTDEVDVWRCTLKESEKREEWERKLESARQESSVTDAGVGSEDVLRVWKDYADMESGTGDPSRAVIVYERCIAEIFLVPEAWTMYASFLSTTVKDFAAAASVLSRATRNCPWMSQLHCLYLRALERQGATQNAVFRAYAEGIRQLQGAAKATAGDRPVADSTIDLRIALLHYGRRQARSNGKSTGGGGAKEVVCRALRKLRDGTTEWAFVMHRAAEIYFRLAEELEDGRAWCDEARSAMERILQVFGTEVSYWLDFINLELAAGHVDKVRNLYKRGVHCLNTLEQLQAFGSSWLSFEEMYGNLELLEVAELKLRSRSGDLHKKRKRKDSTRKPGRHRSSRESRNTDSLNQEAGGSTERSTKRLKADNVEVDEATEVTKDLADVEVAEQSARPARGESRTIFISNLAYTVTKDDLRDVFSNVPGLKEVRLPTRSDGAPKGIAYVDFESDEGVESALRLRLQHLNGRKMYIYKSNPPAVPQGVVKRRGGGRGGGGARRGRGGGNSPGSGGSRPGRVEALSHPSRRIAVEPMVPRSVKTAQNKESKPQAMDTDTTPEKPKTQDDFRSMLR